MKGLTLRAIAIVVPAVLVRSAIAQCMSWDGFPVSPSAAIYCIADYDDGSGHALYCGGDFCCLHNSSHTISHFIARWNGSDWGSMPPGFDNDVYALAVYDDGTGPTLYAGGIFTNYSKVARWSGSTWQSIGAGLSPGFGAGGGAYCMVVYDDGQGPALYVGGSFGSADTVLVNNIAKYDGTNWYPLGTGLEPGYTSSASNLCVYDSGSGPKLYVTGIFSTAGGVPASNGLARWDGTTWSSVSNDYQPSGSGAMAVHDDGTGKALYVGGFVPSVGATRLARWNGSQWSAVGDLSSSGTIDGLASFDDGSGSALYAVGNLYWSGHARSLARWDGVRWSDVGGFITGGRAQTLHAVRPVGGALPKLYVGGAFTGVSGVMSWDIVSWGACLAPIDTFCFGDGSVALCPCSNQGQQGAGCQNSMQAGGTIVGASGSTTSDTLMIQATGILPNVLSLVFQGDHFVVDSPHFGDGLRCIGGHRIRMYTRRAIGGMVNVPSLGDPSIRSRSAQEGDPLALGSVRYYQVYYRDPNPTFCTAPTGNTWNTSNGLRVVW